MAKKKTPKASKMKPPRFSVDMSGNMSHRLTIAVTDGKYTPSLVVEMLVSGAASVEPGEEEVWLRGTERREGRVIGIVEDDTELHDEYDHVERWEELPDEDDEA